MKQKSRKKCCFCLIYPEIRLMSFLSSEQDFCMALTKNLTCFYQYIDWLSSFAEWAQLFWTTSSILEDAEKLNSTHHRYSFPGDYNCVLWHNKQFA